MRKEFCLGLVVGVVALLAKQSAAQVSTNQSSPPSGATNVATLSVEALVADVLEHNPELQFYTAEITAAHGDRRTAGTLAPPEVAAQMGAKNVRERGTRDEGAAWGVSLQQPFEWPGRIPLRKAIANQQIKLAELGHAQFRAALAARARTLAFHLFAAQQKAAATREVADRFQALREVLVQRDPAGLTPVLEARIIEATELTLQRKATAESLQMQTALLELNQLRGQPWNATLHVTSSPLAFPPAPRTEALIAAAWTNNFEVQMRQAELEQQGFRVSLARNDHYPTVSVGPYISQERAGVIEQTVGFGVTMPLPLWSRNEGNIDTAQARERQAQTSFHITQREIERKVAENALRYATKLGEMARWRGDAVDQFREAAALADRHYRLGAVPIATYVELQKQYLEAVEALLDTKKEALEAGQEIQRLTGLDFDAVKVSEPKKGEAK